MRAITQALIAPKAPMPSYRYLTPAQLHALEEYISNLR
jgi:mono/diheme cytochrome c family protein